MDCQRSDYLPLTRKEQKTCWFRQRSSCSRRVSGKRFPETLGANMSVSSRELQDRPNEAAISPVFGSQAIQLKFADEVGPRIRARISYAFRVFASIYGYRVVEEGQPLGTGVSLFYGCKPRVFDDGISVFVPARYRPREDDAGERKSARGRYANESIFLFFGTDDSTHSPDWLGEIFEWLSSDHERSIIQRDSIGRIPFSGSIFSAEQISPRKPYAMLVMSWLQNMLQNRGRVESLPRATSPAADSEHFVVSSHDIDFYYTTKLSALARLLKNLAVSITEFRSWSSCGWNARCIFKTLAGKRVGEYLPGLIDESRRYDFRSTVFVVSERKHRRDPEYLPEDLASHLLACESAEFSLGLHGSYKSVIEEQNLLREAVAMKAALGTKPLGTRQHWLRFGDHQQFFEVVESSGFVYDSTLGFAEAAGFRNGACFAFPPYDFRNEKAHEFLEIPLVLMDGNIAASSRATGEKADAIADEILKESRKWGWGGIAADWHNPLEPLQVPEEINQIFWKCVKNQSHNREKWVSASQFMTRCLSRYHNAGLLGGVRLDA